MVLKYVIGIFAITVIISTAGLAESVIPDLSLSVATRAHPGPEAAVMFNVPNGSGSPFITAGWIFVGSTIDATITLHLRDPANNPVANYPAEDMWLESVADCHWCIRPCQGGAIADADTDANGQTTWTNPLRAGGYSQDLTVVMIAGSPLTSGPGLNIMHNSPDINGDGAVNLSDVSFFSADFFGGYSFRSDFQYDGVVNLSDVSKIAQSIGASCP